MRIIRGKYGRRRFDVPHNITARPTTDFARENIFNVIENLIDLEGRKALDLFAGTGAVSYELLSRGCAEVTAVEKGATQVGFIRKVKGLLGDENLEIVRGDVFRFISSCQKQFDFIFADPPYDLDNFGDVPSLVLNSAMVKAGTLVVIEHSKAYDFSALPHFLEHRVYGSVNFSIFRIGSPEEGNDPNPTESN